MTVTIVSQSRRMKLLSAGQFSIAMIGMTWWVFGTATAWAIVGALVACVWLLVLLAITLRREWRVTRWELDAEGVRACTGATCGERLPWTGLQVRVPRNHTLALHDPQGDPRLTLPWVEKDDILLVRQVAATPDLLATSPDPARQRQTAQELADADAGERRKLRIAGVCLWLLLATALAVAGWGAWRLAAHVQSRDWPTLTATVVQADYFIGDANAGRCQAHLRFAYTVDGERYLSDRHQLGNKYLGGDCEKVEALLNAHPKDSTLEVYVDPANPATAVMVPGPHRFLSPLPLIVGLLLALLALVLLPGTRQSAAGSVASRLRLQLPRPH